MYRYESFVEKYLDVVNRNGPEYMCRCVYHEERNASLQINVEKGLFVCFSGSCGARGTIRTLERHLGIRIHEDAMDVDDMRRRLEELGRPVVVEKTLSENYLRRFSLSSGYWGTCPATCKTGPGCKNHRGFSPAICGAFDLGMDPMGDFATIPLRTPNGDLLGVIKRYLDPDTELRYRYPKGFKRSRNLFASWLVANDPDATTVVLTEGSVDAMKVWEAGTPAMAVYGSSISPLQVRLMKRLGIEDVILFFDNDEAGRKCSLSARGLHQHIRGGKKTYEYRRDTDMRRDFFVRQVQYKPSDPGDPGDMTTDLIRERLKSAGKIG